jgi:hypothetical protein
MSTAAPKPAAPVVLEITVQGTPSPGTPRRRAGLVLLVALAVAGAAGVWFASGAGRPGAAVLAHERGAAGVAAAAGSPLGCLTVTILPTDRTYARADFNHQTICGRYTGYSTRIFHYVAGTWRAALDAVDYTCPVRSLPAAVQTQLGVCLPASYQPAWRVAPGLTAPGLAGGQSRFRFLNERSAAARRR